MFSTLTPINDAGVLLWDPPSTAKLHEVNDLHAVSTPEDFTLELNVFVKQSQGN